MKRLLIVSRTHAPHGGADRIVADLCRQLPSRGWEVRLGLTQGARFNDVGRYLDVLGRDLPAVEIDGRLGTRPARVEAIRRVLRAERPDIVLSMRVFDTYAAAIREKRRRGNAPRLAVGIRSFEAPYLADLAMHRDSVDLCVTSGELLADLAVESCGLPRERVTSIGGGVHPAAAPPRVRERAVRLELLYAGRLDEQQKRVGDLPPLLEALDRLGVRYRLQVAGTGPAEAMLRERLARHIDAGLVAMLGWVGRERLYSELYPQSDVFLHLAGWEGMTIAPREAMAHGAVPVISGFRGLAREGQFVDGSNALVFAVGDVDSAARAVQRLQLEDGLLTRLSAAAIRSQTGRYSFEGALDAWARALDDCLARPARQGELPALADREQGRLSRWGLPASLQSGLRRWLRRPVQHQSPGSEWPTSSGTLRPAQRDEFERAAAAIDAGASANARVAVLHG